MKLGRLAELILGWSLVELLGQAGLRFRQADGCLSLVFLVGLACYACVEVGDDIGLFNHSSRGC